MKQVLNFIGTGSAFNTKSTNTSAFFKPTDNVIVLIDCGESVFNKIIKYKILDSGVKYLHVLITHTHSDHIGSLSTLIHYCYYIRQIKVIVHFPDNSLNQILYLMGNDARQFTFNKIEESKPYPIYLNQYDTLYITPLRVKHFDGLKCFGYLLSRNKTIWYSGDSSEVSENAMSFKPDEIYHEIGNSINHTSLETLCTKFPINKNNVYLIHLDNKKMARTARRKGFKIAEELSAKYKLKLFISNILYKLLHILI